MKNRWALLLLPFAVLNTQTTQADISAQLDSTSELSIHIENQSELKLSFLELVPRLLCQTTTSEGWAGASTLMEQADLQYSTSAIWLEGSHILATVQLDESVLVTAPKKSKSSDTQLCWVGTQLNFRVEGEHYLKHFDGGEVSDSIVSPLGGVTSEVGHKNFTSEFTQELEGHYFLKLIPGGETYCADLGERCAYCTLGLFKKTSEGETKLGHSMMYELLSCTET